MIGHRKWRFAVAALAFGSLSACDTLNEEVRGATPRYWEDVQVGDLYAVEDHTEANRLKARDAYLDTLNMTPQIQQFLRSRYKFAETNVDTKTISPATEIIPQRLQTDATHGAIPTPSDLQTLPISGFPEIEVDSGITVGVEGQPKGLAAVFGFEPAKTLKMSLRFGSVTSYAVRLTDAIAAVDAYCERPATSGNCGSATLAELINQKFNLGPKRPDRVKAASLYLISKVYLARQITYTFNDATLAAAAAATQGSGGNAPAISTTAIDQAVAKGDSSMISALSDLQKSLNDAMAKQTGEGGAVSLAAVTANSVSFNEIFERPVVVGYEAATRAGD